MPFTQFEDMHSGGDAKLDWENIYIEGAEAEARKIFESRFCRDPENITCVCCGNDYSVMEFDTLEEATDFERQLGRGDSEKLSLAQYLQSSHVLVVRAF